MKRHICYVCKQKRYENSMQSIIITGKNGVAYNSWACRGSRYSFAEACIDKLEHKQSLH